MQNKKKNVDQQEQADNQLLRNRKKNKIKSELVEGRVTSLWQLILYTRTRDIYNAGTTHMQY